MIEMRSFSLPTGGELPLLVSSKMPAGFRHGFTTRLGGVSLAPFDSMNLGWKWGDERALVDENHRRLLSVALAPTLLRASQVHGVRVLHVGATDDPARVAVQEADGLCTDTVGLGLSVHVADCTPILMACPRTGACAALHAGWRGTVAGMAQAGARILVSTFGCRPSDLVVALGPCIGACCFEVGQDVVDAFRAVSPAAETNGVILGGAGKKPRIDLRRFQTEQLVLAGIEPDNIDASFHCTRCDPENRFFSFRQSGRATGQMVGFVVRG